MGKLWKRIFKKYNMLRLYATQKENEVHELQVYVHELEAELYNTNLEFEQTKKERNLYWENLTRAKKEKLAAGYDQD